MSYSVIHVFGCGGHALVILDILEQQGVSVCFYDDDSAITHSTFEGYNFLGPINNCTHYTEHDLFIVAIGDNRKRKEIYTLFKNDMCAATIIHEGAIVSPKSVIGIGSTLFASAVVNRNTSIGNNTIINTCAVVEHDCNIGQHVHIAPHATVCGGVTVGAECLVGANSTILPGLKIGDRVVIGAGSVVTRNVSSGEVVKNVF